MTAWSREYLWLEARISLARWKFHLWYTRSTRIINLITSRTPLNFLKFHRFPYQMARRILKIILSGIFHCFARHLMLMAIRRWRCWGWRDIIKVTTVLFIFRRALWSTLQFHQCTLAVLFIVQLKHFFSYFYFLLLVTHAWHSINFSNFAND